MPSITRSFHVSFTRVLNDFGDRIGEREGGGARLKLSSYAINNNNARFFNARSDEIMNQFDRVNFNFLEENEKKEGNRYLILAKREREREG